MRSSKVTGIILAGGKSTRIGSNKSLLKFDEGLLIDRVLETLAQFTPSIVIVTDEAHLDLIRPPTSNARVLQDIYPGKGPLGGIYTGLSYSQDIYNLVVGCDMPFLNGDLISYLIDGEAGFDAIVPKIGWRIQPLHAIYSKRCLPSIEALIREEQLQIIKLFNQVNTRYVTEKEIDQFDPDHLSFLNINTKDDLMKAEVLVQRTKVKGTQARDSK